MLNNIDTRYNYQLLRDKYIKMAKSQGISNTITALHNEIGELERHVFDDGYKEARLDIVQKLRVLSREIWTAQFAE